ncbi:rhodanese-like domain-containing protein [Planctomicrobium sp. SH664]|uniref:rhodanese-like domain-containing protein n=1 Tax=Planctomicrobium sp. SH664 TaxID=3448125 RepID=UPI003F5B502A
MSATITASQLADLHRQGKPIDLIDVRTPAEFGEVHVDFAQNVPLNQLQPEQVVKARRSPAEEPIYVICKSGGRGRQAQEQFIKAGFPNTVNVEGGTTACLNSGLPLTHGKKVMSLERQVRIAAGSLVLLGVILGWFVAPAFFGLAAFVGAGLVFAGITDTCGMGMLLAQMPWNQKCSR